MEQRQRSIVEFAGALVLMFVAGAAIVTSGGDVPVVAAALGVAFAGLWWAFGDRGRVHFNPVLTLADAAARRLPTKDLPHLLGAQALGAIVAGALLFAVFDGSPFMTGGSGLAAAAPTLAGWALLSILLLEVLVTAAFVLAWLRLSEDPTDRPTKGLALGALYGGAALATLGLTWSALNPLRTLGPALFGAMDLGAALVFWIAAIIGAALAAAVHIAVHDRERWAQLTNAFQTPQP